MDIDRVEIRPDLAGLDPVPTTEHTLTSVEALRSRVRQVRSQGFALVDQELEYGLRSLAAPVHNRAGTVVAAVNVSTQASRVGPEETRRALLPPLLKAVAEIENDLSRSP